jgi:hypothetical protein
MNLRSKSNQELIRVLKVQVENERKLLMDILYSLQEVEARSLHLEMGYPDIYTFAMKELGYSSGSAYRRISAMRLLKTLPEAAPKLASGELGLENASQVQSYFRKEDQSRREQGLEKLSLHEKREVVSELLGKSTREGLRLLTERSPDVMTPTEKIKPLPEQKTLVQFVASVELMNKLDELKHLLAHQNFDGQMDILIEKLADMALKRLKPDLNSNCLNQTAKTSPAETSDATYAPAPVLTDSLPAPGVKATWPSPKTRSRHIPAAVKK